MIVAAPHPGRGLDAARTQQIYLAAAELLAEVGFERLTMDAVAARAKASKATLYRRWDSKAELVIEAIQSVRGDTEASLPDTGTLRGDLLELFETLSGARAQSQICMMRGLVSACSADQALAHAVQQKLVDTKRSALLVLMSRARSRGEIPADRDLEFLVDVLPASFMYRYLITHQPVDHHYVQRLVDEVALPLLTQPDVFSAMTQPLEEKHDRA
jgi:AcrR family transcriptional regulator